MNIDMIRAAATRIEGQGGADGEHERALFKRRGAGARLR